MDFIIIAEGLCSHAKCIFHPGMDFHSDGGLAPLSTFSGTIRFSPLEGGFWKLDSPDGNTYQLVGSLRNLKDGQLVVVEGEIERRRVSFAMAGPILNVQSIVLQE